MQENEKSVYVLEKYPLGDAVYRTLQEKFSHKSSGITLHKLQSILDILGVKADMDDISDTQVLDMALSYFTDLQDSEESRILVGHVNSIRGLQVFIELIPFAFATIARVPDNGANRFGLDLRQATISLCDMNVRVIGSRVNYADIVPLQVSQILNKK